MINDIESYRKRRVSEEFIKGLMEFQQQLEDKISNDESFTFFMDGNMDDRLMKKCEELVDKEIERNKRIHKLMI